MVGPGTSPGTHHPCVGHCLELQVENALLTRLSRGAGHRRAVVVGQEKAVAFSSGATMCSDVLITRAAQVCNDFISLLHQGAHWDLQGSMVAQPCST